MEDKKQLKCELKELEVRLKKILKENKINVLENDDRKTFIRNMKEYIKHINEADELFRRYEMLVEILCEDTEDDQPHMIAEDLNNEKNKDKKSDGWLINKKTEINKDKNKKQKSKDVEIQKL